MFYWLQHLARCHVQVVSPPCPLQWERGALASGLPGRSQKFPF